MAVLKPVSVLLPKVLEGEPPMVNGDDPIILTGAYLRHSEVHMLESDPRTETRSVGERRMSLRAAFGSYGILRRIAESEPSQYYKTLWSRSRDIPIWVGASGFDASFDEVLQGFAATGFGGGIVSRGERENLVTLGHALELVAQGDLVTPMALGSVSSSPIGVDEEVTILEAVRAMLAHRVRRLFVNGKDGRFISDRGILEYIFRPERLTVARDTPEAWVDGRVSDIRLKAPVRYEGDDIAGAARLMGESPDDCVTTEKGDLVSRWDVVVKPWIAGKLGPGTGSRVS